MDDKLVVKTAVKVSTVSIVLNIVLSMLKLLAGIFWKANGKHGQVPEKKRYEDEIIIGVTRYPEKKQTNNQKNTKKVNKKFQKRRKMQTILSAMTD